MGTDRVVCVSSYVKQPSGLPLSFVNLAKKQGIPDLDNHGLISVAEAGTLQVTLSLIYSVGNMGTHCGKVLGVIA